MLSRRSAGRWPAAAFTKMLRRVGLDANPMRRGLDHAEAAVTVLLALVFVVAGPVISVAVGESVAHAETPAFGLEVGVLVQTTIGLLLWDVRRITRRLLDRQRLARWERAWELVEPRWSRRP